MSHTFHTFRKAKMTDYTGTTIKLPQEVALSLDQHHSYRCKRPPGPSVFNKCLCYIRRFRSKTPIFVWLKIPGVRKEIGNYFTA